MAIKGYAVGCKKNASIVKDIVVKRRMLPNGNKVTIICGKSKNCGVVCTIVENKKAVAAAKPKSKPKAKSKASKSKK